jgi:type VI secretion system (T6SS) effector TldE1-like protein
VPDARLQETNTISRWVKRFVRVDTGLIAAGIAVLGIGFALNLAGTHAIWPASTEPQTKSTAIEGTHPKSFNLIGSVGSQIPDGSGMHGARLETKVASESAVQTEKASESAAASAPCTAFDERFYFDGQLASFDERFASAFGLPGNARGKAAEAGEYAKSMLLQQLEVGEHAERTPPLTRSASRLASVREERLDTAEASRGLSLPLEADSHTAIYDIVARKVYLPSGHSLEAHSGLGSHLDDPRHVNAKGQGPTPPNVYSLTLRERLFHGVRAIRLIPVDDRKMFGRDGILAHSYMLGPSGQSNGCVSFRNYAAFLHAFLRGEVDRLVVVEHLATTAGAKTSAASGG